MIVCVKLKEKYFNVKMSWYFHKGSCLTWTPISVGSHTLQFPVRFTSINTRSYLLLVIFHHNMMKKKMQITLSWNWIQWKDLFTILKTDLFKFGEQRRKLINYCCFMNFLPAKLESFPNYNEDSKNLRNFYFCYSSVLNRIPNVRHTLITL